MEMQTPPAGFAAHLDTVQARYEAALAVSGYDAVVIGAGTQSLRFMDDQHAPFRANPQLLQWLPLANHPGSSLLYQPGERPVAVMVRPESYWEEPPAAPGAPWCDHVDVRIVGRLEDVTGVLGPLPEAVALLGPDGHWDALGFSADRNPAALVQHLNYDRAWKTEFEVACMRSATAKAVAGHGAAAAAFHAGGSEFDLLLAFQQGCAQSAADLPYPPIIGVGPHGAVLHYQHYRHARDAGASLLIDAGCTTLGYASDITRTHVRAGHDAFRDLRDDLDAVQQELCGRVRPGVPFADLHHAAHEAIAGVLCRQSLLSCTPAAAIDQALTGYFFPHGLGHLLGLQVHDVGGHLADATGNALEAPAAYPRLRLLRTLDAGFVLTIEPGIYFIDSLLRELRSKAAADVNWERVDALRPYGGIRIEDNLHVTADGHENLTRLAFAG